MSKPKGRRRTLRDELRRRRAIAERNAAGEVCVSCGQAVPFDQATFYAADGSTVVYCLGCAFSDDTEGYVALLWGRSKKHTGASEGGREAPPSSCEVPGCARACSHRLLGRSVGRPSPTEQRGRLRPVKHKSG